MRHARLTRFVDRIVAVSLVCLVLSILCVAAVAEAVRVRLSRASRAASPATGSSVATLRFLRVSKSWVDPGNVAGAVRVVPFTPRDVGVATVGDQSSALALSRECVELDGETGSFI